MANTRRPLRSPGDPGWETRFVLYRKTHRGGVHRSDLQPAVYRKTGLNRGRTTTGRFGWPVEGLGSIENSLI